MTDKDPDNNQGQFQGQSLSDIPEDQWDAIKRRYHPDMMPSKKFTCPIAMKDQTMTDKDTSKAKALTALGSVERFHASEFSGTMIPSPCGDWVRHSDYDVLSAALEAAEMSAKHWHARAENYGTLANVNQHGWDLEKARAEEAEIEPDAYRTARAEAAKAERDALKAKFAETVEAIQFAANRLEMIADDGWNGDARDFKRSLVGVLSEFRTFLASLEGDKS